MPYKDLNKRRECNRIAEKKWRDKRIALDPLFTRRRNLKTKYGLTLEEWESMYSVQNGLCAICKRELKRADTDHKDCMVRSLLCKSCNQGLGRFQDDPTLLRLAADYIEGKIVTFIPICKFNKKEEQI